MLSAMTAAVQNSLNSGQPQTISSLLSQLSVSEEGGACRYAWSWLLLTGERRWADERVFAATHGYAHRPGPDGHHGRRLETASADSSGAGPISEYAASLVNAAMARGLT